MFATGCEKEATQVGGWLTLDEEVLVPGTPLYLVVN